MESSRANIALMMSLLYKLFDCQTIIIITRNNIFEQPMTRRKRGHLHIQGLYIRLFAQESGDELVKLCCQRNKLDNRSLGLKDYAEHLTDFLGKFLISRDEGCPCFRGRNAF